MSTKNYIGYIYIWYDTKSKFFYIGGHKGSIEDSYICSNKMMLRSYRKRPETFRFRVLEYIYGELNDIRIAEQKWLDMIKDCELYQTQNIYNNTTRYYNQKKISTGGNGFANKGNRNLGGWNKGYSKEEIMLRKERLLSFIPLDIPKVKITKPQKKSKRIPKTYCKVYLRICHNCFDKFYTRHEHGKSCSKKCSGKLGIKQGGGFIKGKAPWNKGMDNPKSADNGKKGAAKLSKKVTGRKLSNKINPLTGKRYWIYP